MYGAYGVVGQDASISKYYRYDIGGPALVGRAGLPPYNG